MGIWVRIAGAIITFSSTKKRAEKTAAWSAFYTPEHVRAILRRSAACKLGRPGTTLSIILWFYLMILFEGVYPLEGGAFRLKFRRDRRSNMKIESPIVFYPRYGWETLWKAWGYLRVYRQLKAMLNEALAAPDRSTYTDIANRSAAAE